MNAQVKPLYKSMRNELADMVTGDGYPIDYIKLTEEEAIRWIDEEGRKPESVSSYLLEAMSDFDTKQFAKADELVTKMMLGTMTVDEATQWRDMQKEALKDYCSRWARRMIDMDTL